MAFISVFLVLQLSLNIYLLIEENTVELGKSDGYKSASLSEVEMG